MEKGKLKAETEFASKSFNLSLNTQPFNLYLQSLQTLKCNVVSLQSDIQQLPILSFCK